MSHGHCQEWLFVAQVILTYTNITTKQSIEAISQLQPTSPSDQQDGLVSMDRTRLWYLLYICDQHLSILYNRAPMIREEETILGWKAYLESSNSTDSDTRISSQVALLVIMSQIRDLFGTDTSQPIPKAFASHILSFSQQLDRWLAQWSTALSTFIYDNCEKFADQM
jgi:hypothetical protein